MSENIIVLRDGTASYEGNTIEIPEYIFEDGDATLYQIIEFLRGNIEISTYKCTKLVNGRKMTINEDSIICRDDIVSINLQKNNFANIDMQTGSAINEHGTASKVLIDQLQTEIDTITQNFKSTILTLVESINDTMKSMIYTYELDSTDDEGYIGELVNGLPHGYGKRTRCRKFSSGENNFEFNNVYEGYWLEGKFHGTGKFISYEKDDLVTVICIYEGNYNAGKRHGNGVFTNEDGKLEGEWNDNDLIGHATMTYTNGDVYVGEWDCECRQGKGKMIFTNGEILEEEWIDDEIKKEKE